MLVDDAVLGGFLRDIDRAIEEKSPTAPPKDALESLREDVRKLGYLGLLVVLADSPPPESAALREHVDAVRRRLFRGLAANESLDAAAAVDLGAIEPLPALLDRYLAEKGDKGPSLARKALENALYEHYELKESGLFVDDVAKALSLTKAQLPPSDDVKSVIRAMTRLSSDTARFILGLFPEQIDMIHKIGQRQAEQHEIDNVFEAFGPGAIQKRIFGATQAILTKDVRLRLTLSLYGRSRGVPITREQILGIGTHLEVKTSAKTLARACERKEARAALLAFVDAHPDVATLDRML